MLVAMLALSVWLVSGRPCGSPPSCQCHSTVHTVDCDGIEAMPRFSAGESRLYKRLFLAGTMDTVPELGRWTSLKEVDVSHTSITCRSLAAWRRTVTFAVKAPRCANATGV